MQIAGLTEYQGQVGKDKNVLRLLIAAAIVEEMRLAIFEQTTFRCSAGISHNKVAFQEVFLRRIYILQLGLQL